MRDLELQKLTKSIWRDNNPDKVKEYGRKYKEENKDKLNETYNCKCGGKYSWKHQSTHFKTQKHKKGIEGIDGIL